MGDKGHQTPTEQPFATAPSVGRIVHVPVDPVTDPASGAPFTFSRVFIIGRVWDHQALDGHIFLLTGDTYKGNVGPGVFEVEKETNWHWPNLQQPYAGR